MKNKSVKEIKEIVDSLSIDKYLEYMDILKDDERKSVQNIAIKMGRKLDNIRKEEERLERINTYENEGYTKGYLYIGGIDEAGRGPLAGPVVIKEEALDYGISIVNNEDIDKYNILNATYMAMKKALNCLKNTPDYLLIDAATIPGIDIHQKPIIKGDSKSISIAAASILAKVTRDNIMYQYDEIFPEYGFKSHKGYGTKEHYEAIEKYGITRIHRKSFLKNML